MKRGKWILGVVSILWFLAAACYSIHDSRRIEETLRKDSFSSEIVEEKGPILEEAEETNYFTSDAVVSDSSEIEKKCEEKKNIYKIAQDLYLKGLWDGSPTNLYSYQVSVSEKSGNILIEDAQVTNYPDIDLPKDFDEARDMDSNIVYIYPEEAAYAIKDRTLVKLAKGEMITLGEPLEYKGLDMKNLEELGCKLDNDNIYFPNFEDLSDYRYVYDYTPYLYYSKDADELLLVTTEPSYSDLKYYLYRFPDYNVSKVEYLETILDYSVYGSLFTGDKFYYLDTEYEKWVYEENGPQPTDARVDLRVNDIAY